MNDLDINGDDLATRWARPSGRSLGRNSGPKSWGAYRPLRAIGTYRELTHAFDLIEALGVETTGDPDDQARRPVRRRTPAGVPQHDD